jgi:hypothetical protein
VEGYIAFAEFSIDVKAKVSDLHILYSHGKGKG